MKISDKYTTAKTLRAENPEYVVNSAYNQAALFFEDGSYLQFEHTSRQNRWAKPSAGEGMAEDYCQMLRQFRLNAKHLQLFFIDGSNVEFGLKSGEILEQE